MTLYFRCSQFSEFDSKMIIIFFTIFSFSIEQQPCQVEQQQHYGFACLSGPLSVTVQTDRGGYCPGESIAISAFINNQSGSRLCGVEIILYQVSVYTIKSGKYI